MDKVFKSFIAKTSNIRDLLKKTAVKYNISLQSLDYEILKTTTGIRTPENENFLPINESTKNQLDSDEILLKPKLEIKESYEINVFQKRDNEPTLLEMGISIDKYHTKAVGVIKKESKFTITKTLKEDILKAVQKKMALLQICIGVRNKNLIEELDKISSEIIKNHHLLEDKKITLTQWVTPVATIHDKLHFHYKKMPQNKERIDSANRGFLKEVKSGDLILEYIPPKIGLPGRNFHGNFIGVVKPKYKYKNFFTIIDESVDFIEKEDGRVEYYGKKDGFIKLSKRTLQISDNLDLSSINFKKTGNIETDLDKNITIKTKGGKDGEDIGNNMKVTTTNIDIAKNVGSNAQIKAVNVAIGGQTHQSSKIECKNAKISNHRGELKCEKAIIDILEGGVVYGDLVIVKYIKGGKIFANEVKIGTLSSNNFIKASSKIHIKKTDKEGENVLIIDPSATTKERVKIKTLTAKREELDTKRKIIKRKCDDAEKIVAQNMESAKELKESIDKENQAGRRANPLFVEKYKLYLRDVKKAKIFKEAFRKTDREFNNSNQQLLRLQRKVLNAHITNDDLWRGFNKIMFKVLMPSKEYIFIPPEKSQANLIQLAQINYDNPSEGFKITTTNHKKGKSQ